MSKRIDLTGQTFGEIYVIEGAGRQGSQALFKCLCPKCDGHFFVTGCNLKNQVIKGCSNCRNSERKLFTLDQEKRIIEKYNKGILFSALCKEFKTNRSTIYGILRRHGVERTRKLTPEQRAFIFHLHKNGMSVSRISGIYDMTYDGIHKVIQKIKKDGLYV